MEFFNGQYVLINRAGNSESYKFLSPTAVAAAFRSAPVDSGWLPPGILRCGTGLHGDFAVARIPAQRHALNLETGKRIRKLSVPLPELIFFGYGKAFYVWAINGELLFTAPLPNVFGGGGICWGTNKPPRASVATLAKAWELFIASPFNGHAANNKSVSHTRDVRGLLRELNHSRKFPAAELLPERTTLKARIDRLLQRENADE